MKKQVSKRSLRQLLEAQFMLLHFVNSKLEIFNYIANGYEQNQPILMNNRFLIYVAHILQKSLIIDFAALFGGSKNEKNNFHLLYSDEYKGELSEDAFIAIRDELSKYRPSKDPVKSIVHLRNTQVAHYDPNGDDDEQKLSIYLNWDYRAEMNELYKVGKLVIKICSDELGTNYRFPSYKRLKNLDKMVEILATAKQN